MPDNDNFVSEGGVETGLKLTVRLRRVFAALLLISLTRLVFQASFSIGAKLRLARLSCCSVL